MTREATQRYDLIGDIHGHARKLTALLVRLGYLPADGEGDLETWRHPDCRRVIFLGDFIDRGPDSPKVLQTVKGMIDAGDAFAVMGNHEYNAICWHTPDGRGGWLRERRKGRDEGLLETIQQFEENEEEWMRWIEWMKGLPFFIEIDGIRAVHACWDSKRIEFLKGRSLSDSHFLEESTTKGTQAFRAVDNILKGPELPLPRGSTYLDKDGVERKAVRSRWWNVPEGATRVGAMVLPEPMDLDELAVAFEVRRIPSYPSDDFPVFFGHYWRPPDAPKEPYAPNLACLDYSAAFGEAPLVAYRWDGESELRSEKFVY